RHQGQRGRERRVGRARDRTRRARARRRPRALRAPRLRLLDAAAFGGRREDARASGGTRPVRGNLVAEPPCLTDGAHTMQELPQRFDDVESLERFLSEPTPAPPAHPERIDGDTLVLGGGRKRGPAPARMARRAAPDRRVIGVARFSDPATRASLEAHGVECIACDLLDRTALERLPNVADGVRNVVFMAGHKFGAAGNASLTWMMNVGVPMNVAEVYREARIVAFSTACVYPFVPVDGPGADESVAPNPPAGDYANSCVGRERMFEYGSQKWGTPGRLVR